jgi:hypothetical protein
MLLEIDFFKTYFEKLQFIDKTDYGRFLLPTAVFEYGLAWFKKLIDVQSVEESIVNWSCGSVFLC